MTPGSATVGADRSIPAPETVAAVEQLTLDAAVGPGTVTGRTGEPILPVV